MITLLRVFVSYPFKEDPSRYRREVDLVCKMLFKEHGVLPISPLHLFSFIEEEDDMLRDMIMDICFNLIRSSSDILYCFGNFATSSGCYDEWHYARTLGKPTYLKDVKFENGEAIITDRR